MPQLVNLQPCPNCGKKLPSGSLACPACGRSFLAPPPLPPKPPVAGVIPPPPAITPSPPSTARVFLGLAGLLVGIFFLSWLFGAFDRTGARSSTPIVQRPETAAEIASRVRQQALASDQARWSAAAKRGQEAIDKAESARIAEEERIRGPKPVPSKWDGITPEANAWLKENLKDYGSMELVECSEIFPIGRGWGQRVKLRAKNSFGAYNVESYVFTIKNGTVIEVTPLG